MLREGTVLLASEDTQFHVFPEHRPETRSFLHMHLLTLDLVLTIIIIQSFGGNIPGPHPLGILTPPLNPPSYALSTSIQYFFLIANSAGRQWCWEAMVLGGNGAGRQWCLGGNGARRQWCWEAMVLGRQWCWEAMVLGGNSAGRIYNVTLNPLL